jgi:hypothetical protein
MRLFYPVKLLGLLVRLACDQPFHDPGVVSLSLRNVESLGLA